MPLEIIRSNIVTMKVDAIVNPANPKPTIGSGCDRAIHTAAGPQLMKARMKIGDLLVGHPVITPAYMLPAKYVIHVAGPSWHGGRHNELRMLAACYRESLVLAAENQCASVAFPLLSAGNYAIPHHHALRTAITAISDYLMQTDSTMRVWLVLLDAAAYTDAVSIYGSIESRITEAEIRAVLAAEYTGGRQYREYPMSEAMPVAARPKGAPLDDAEIQALAQEMKQVLKQAGPTFSNLMMSLIREKKLQNSQVYKAACIDRQLFSKILCHSDYRPGKSTVLALAVGMQCDLAETDMLLESAGYAFSNSSQSDIIVRHFIRQGKPDISDVNYMLELFGLPRLK